MRSTLIPTFILLAVVGCAGTGGMKKPDFSVLLPPGPPAKAMAVWEPAVKHDGDKDPVRGFGGRIYFYDQDGKRPIKIKGGVVVYAFDEDGRAEHDNEPSRSYLFDEADVKRMYSKSKLGHSYNFWVPWDSEGPDGNAKKVSLIVRYIPEVGSSVVSSQAVVYLPGKKNQTEMMAKAEWESRQAERDAIRQVANRDASGRSAKNVGASPEPEEYLVESNDNRPLSMQTSTISIPRDLSQGIRNALAQPAPVAAPIEKPGIQPASYNVEKPTEAEAEPAPVSRISANPRRDPANRRGTF